MATGGRQFKRASQTVEYLRTKLRAAGDYGLPLSEIKKHVKDCGEGNWTENELAEYVVGSSFLRQYFSVRSGRMYLKDPVGLNSPPGSPRRPTSPKINFNERIRTLPNARMPKHGTEREYPIVDYFLQKLASGELSGGDPVRQAELQRFADMIPDMIKMDREMLAQGINLTSVVDASELPMSPEELGYISEEDVSDDENAAAAPQRRRQGRGGGPSRRRR